MKQRIEALEKELAKLKAEYNTTYQPKPGAVFVLDGCLIHRTYKAKGNAAHYDSLGKSYSDMAVAEKARNFMTAHDIVLKYVYDHCPDYDPDWLEEDEQKYFVAYDHPGRKWVYSWNVHWEILMPAMPKWVDQKLCDDLNKGRLNLYPFKE